jgi:isochorismate synthase EntC
MYTQAHGERECVTCEFFVPTLHIDEFRVVVPLSNRRKLQMGIQVPSLFGAKHRQEKVNRRNQHFNQNNHENTAYKKIVEKIQSNFDDGSTNHVILGNLQEVDLPFECEDDVQWELCLHANRDLEDRNGVHFHTILKCLLKSIVKPKTKHRARVRVVDDDNQEFNDASEQPMEDDDL